MLNAMIGFQPTGTSFLLAVGFIVAFASSGHPEPRCEPMELPVRRLEGRPTQYEDFCQRHPASCILDGQPVTAWTSQVQRQLDDVNSRVNGEVAFVSDMDNLGLEENWDFPTNCMGDCEDFVLEKRERLVEMGFSRASLTIAIAFHETEFFPHAVLLAETTAGTWVLDNLSDEILCWDAVPYRYTRRETPDGNWVRFTHQ
jgi:predicted transglutaminase-like cysteine proteinase